MYDNEYEGYMNDLMQLETNTTIDPNNRTETDEEFTDNLDKIIRDEPKPRRRPSA